jgi:hypothetical protein
MNINSLSRGCRVVLKCAVAGLTLLVTAGPAVAQTESAPKWDIFAGYQWLHPGITTPVAFGDPSNPSRYVVPDITQGLGGAVTYNGTRTGRNRSRHSSHVGNYDSTISGVPFHGEPKARTFYPCSSRL